MSIRIETIEQLQDPVLLEKVLDRLRRTTHPRQFAYKKRCKALGDKPLLLTAPPGRKLKSTLLRQLRLGTPTYKGTVHREEQQLIFTFKTSVNPTETARWIAKCMHDAKSPVPLKCIVIRGPLDTGSPTEIETTETDAHLETSDLHLPEMGDLPNIDDSLEELEELNSSNISEPPTLEILLQQHTSSKKLRWFKETEDQIIQYEQDCSALNSTIEDMETELYELESERTRLEAILQTELAPISTGPNPWTELFEQCQKTNWSLEEIRDCIARAELDAGPLLKELQFLSDDEEMKAFRIVRQYSTESAQEWDLGSKSTEWQQAQTQYNTIQQRYQHLSNELEQQQQALEIIERNQEQTLQKFSKRKLDVYQKLKTILVNNYDTAESTMTALDHRIHQCQLFAFADNSTE